MCLSYFNKNIDCFVKSVSLRIRHTVVGLKNILRFTVGDIIEVVYFSQGLAFKFEGICISVKRKKFVLPDVSFILRNIFLGVGIELSLSYFYNRLYGLNINDYKRKANFVRRAKLLYIRNRLNRESRVI